MKLNFLERTVTCCLVGAATIAIASGWKRADPPEGDGVRFVNLDGFEKSTEPEADELAMEQEVARVIAIRRDGNDDTAEQGLDTLVKAFKKATGLDKEGIRSSLNEALTKVFRERTEAQRTRIAGMKERLDAIESQLDRRSKLEEQIVQRRLGELLGDRDELSWDHETALESLEFAEHRRESRDPLDHAVEYAFEFPMEYPTYRESPASADKGLSRSRAEFQRAKNLAEERATVRSAKEKDINVQEVRSRLGRDIKKWEDRLPVLEGFRGSLLEEQSILERNRGMGAESEALRAELAAMRAQSEMLKKQLDELSKQKSKASKQSERP